MVPLADVLGQLGAELRLMADVLGIVEDAVARIIAMVGERGTAIAGDLQNIDIIDQSLRALAAFIRELASDVPAGWSVDDVDLFEVNEAFACVAMIAMRDLGIPHEKINVNGGATALGHPIGASGARITTTLIAALQDRGLKRGVASLCIGGGEATAIAVELV